MKKRSALLLFAFIFVTYFSQAQERECVSCSNNEIDFSKFASGIGSFNSAAGLNSFVGGINSTVSGNYSFAFGDYARAEGLSSIALGHSSFASGMYSVAIGRESVVPGVGAFSIGYMNQANGNSSFLFGKYLKSYAGDAVTIGVGTPDYLVNGIAKSLMVGFNSNLPTLFVGESNGSGTTGEVGIGNITDPQAKLHIRADAADDATLRLEPGTGKVSRIYFSNTNDYYVQAANNQNMVFGTLTGKHYEFQNGTLRGVNGTAQAPAFSFSSNNSNTGIFLASTSTLAFSTAGFERVRINNSGNVGIGTSTLNNRLEVNGLVNTTSGYKVGNTEVINGTMDYSGRNGTLSGNLSVTGTSTLTGNVGIGLPNPTIPFEVKKSGITSDWTYVARLTVEGTSANNAKVLSLKNNSIDDVFLVYGDGRIETKGKSINFIGSENQGNPGISFQNGSPTKYWIGHNNVSDVFFIGGTGGATPEMGAINILNGNVGIGTNAPAKALDVNGDINLTNGDIYKNNQLIDFSQWDVNGTHISYNQGNVGIGLSDPTANLHISSNAVNTTASFFKVENNGQPGSGTTIIGKQVSGGPVIVQQAGTTAFTTQGSTLSILQKSANGDTGFGISTYTATDGTVRWVDMYAPASDCYLRSEDNLFIQSRTGSVKLETSDGIHYIHLNANGQLGIGTQTHIDNNFTKLTVAGRIHAQEVKVNINAGADFVFDKSYDLPGIAKTEDFIKANKHLPGISSAEEMQQNGLDLGEIQIKLLQKIEELTLYVIELNKRIKELELENSKIKYKAN